MLLAATQSESLISLSLVHVRPLVVSSIPVIDHSQATTIQGTPSSTDLGIEVLIFP
jgi:hypothetical protein